MKKFLSYTYTLTMLVLILSLTSCSSKKELNVMTFNIRLDAAVDSLNNWQYRKDVAAQIVQQYDVDILGTQEVLPNQLKDLLDRLPEYAAVGLGRDNGGTQGEHSSLFFKKSRFRASDFGTFWLSDTPDVPSKGWDGAYPRIASWAILEDLVSKQSVFAINTHLDHIGVEARIRGVELILKKAEILAKGLPIILTGDFNSTPDSEIIRSINTMGQKNALVNSRLAAAKVKDNVGTFHDFGRLALDELQYIDYIFVSDSFKVNYYEVVPDKLHDIYLSDHNPVFARIAFK